MTQTPVEHDTAHPALNSGQISAEDMSTGCAAVLRGTVDSGSTADNVRLIDSIGQKNIP